MKKFLLGNILLSACSILGVNQALDNAFLSKKIDINFSNVTNSFLSLKATQESLTDLLEENVMSEEDYSLLSELDFSDVEIIDNSKKSISNESIKFVEVTKEINLKSNQINSDFKNNFELSYIEVEPRKAYKTVNPVKTIAWTDSFKGIKSINKEDRISTALAATEKSTPSNNNKKAFAISKSSKDELVFFEYSKKEVKSKNKKEVKNLGNSIAKNESATNDLMAYASNALMKKSKGSLVQPLVSKGNSLVDINDLVGESGKVKPTPKAVKSKNACDREEFVETIGNSKVLLTADSIFGISDKYEALRSFELRFQDDLDETHQDYGEGKIELKYKLTSQMNTRRAVILAKGHYPTSFDLVLENTESEVNIPVFTREHIESYFKETNSRDIGAHLIVELDEKTEDVFMDEGADFEAKAYLNKSLKIVDRNSSDYSYVLFLGVSAGNRVLNYKLINQKETSRIINLVEGEMFYDPNFYAEVVKDRLSFYEESLLSQCKAKLNISKKEVKTWSYEGKVSKTSLNSFNISKMVYPLGTRKYYEVNHLDESLYAGRWSSTEVEIPTESYISLVLNELDSKMDNQCVVQINLSKPVKEFIYNGISNSNNMRPEIKVLDKDGNFYDDFSLKSQRVFIKGNEQGLLGIKIQYTDGSYQFVQTFCSNSTYLVEQL